MYDCLLEINIVCLKCSLVACSRSPQNADSADCRLLTTQTEYFFFLFFGEIFDLGFQSPIRLKTEIKGKAKVLCLALYSACLGNVRVS